MSIQDIANYVRQTPGNTNPSVIKSMVKSEIGEYVEEASNEALRKLGIKKEPAKVIVKFDLIAADGMTMYEEGNTSIRFVAGQTYIVKTDTGTYIDVCEYRELNGMLIFFIGNPTAVGEEDNGKSYDVIVACIDDNWFVRAEDMASGSHMTISTPEVIYPIDPKYLPGPVTIDLAEYGIDLATFVMGGGGELEIHGGTYEMWSKINAAGGNVKFAASMGDATNIALPCMITRRRGKVRAVYFQVQGVMSNLMISTTIEFIGSSDLSSDDFNGDTTIRGVVTQTPIP